MSWMRLSSVKDGLLSTEGSISVASVVESCRVSVSSLKIQLIYDFFLYFTLNSHSIVILLTR